MRWKGLAAAVAVLLCPVLWWQSSVLVLRADGGTTPGSEVTVGDLVPADSSVTVPTSSPSSPTATAGQPSAAAAPSSASPSRTSAASDGQTPARPRKDTRTNRSVPYRVGGIEVISKKHRVNAKYSPTLVKTAVSSTGAGTVRLQAPAASALKAMFAAAKKAGFRLTVRSAYRSYATQAAWYRTGDHNLVAPPGASEHQSGLAVDLAWLKGTQLVRGTQLGTSKAGAWLRRHAAEYGFIVRYPPGTQRITGISFESWHFRYVGVSAAKGVTKTKSKTLEEYLGLAH